MQYSRNQFLMGTDINITIISNNNALEDIYNCFGIFYSLEKEFTRFSIISDLSLLNENKKFEVSDRFIDVLKLAKNIYNVSNGFFNPLVNLSNIGYSNDFGKGIFKQIKKESNLDLSKISVIGNTIELKENQILDLGGIVKGYAVDLVSKYLIDKSYKNFIINAGGDIYLSGNNYLGEIPVVAIDNPFNDSEIFATLEVRDKAISTSGTYKRKWNCEGEDFHHILNPKTNTNNNEIISITLIASDCYIADSYATACIAMGLEKSLVFLQEENIHGIIIGSDGIIHSTHGMSDYNLNII